MILTCFKKNTFLFSYLFFFTATATSTVKNNPLTFTPPQIYYYDKHVLDPANRKASTPYISGDTFRSIADFFIDEMRLPINPRNIKNGDIIFVMPDLLNYFCNTLRPHITSYYILISTNSVLPSPGKYIDLLNDEKLIAWFAQNADVVGHPKLIPIPVGIANRYWPHGSVSVLDNLISQLPSILKNKFLYLNINPHTHASIREQAIQLFTDKSFCYKTAPKPWTEYLLDLASSKFVLSPRGNGLDCHRTWEALLMGSIPIVTSSTLNPLYDDLPVLIVSEWQEITQDFLEKKYAEIKSKQHNEEKMYAPYWLKKIEMCQKNFKGSMKLNNV